MTQLGNEVFDVILRELRVKRCSENYRDASTTISKASTVRIEWYGRFAEEMELRGRNSLADLTRRVN
jgi:hypothetical protein